MKIILISFLAILLLGCSSIGPGSLSGSTKYEGLRTFGAEGEELTKVSSVVLLPVTVDESAMVCSQHLDLYEALETNFQAEVSLQLITGEKVGERFMQSAARSIRERGLRVGSEVKADAVLLTTIDKCEERIGSKLGVANPASVGMTLQLLRVTDGQELWRASYAVSDRALSEDLLNLNRRLSNKPGWRSSSDLIREGMRSAASELESRRKAHFLTK